MTRYRVVVTAVAEQDVRDIADYISSDSGIAARRFGTEFSQTIDRIGEFPGTGYSLVKGERPLLGTRVSPDSSTIR